MLDTMSAGEFQRWMAYYEAEPFGEHYRADQADARGALHTAAVVNTLRAAHGGRSTRMLKPSDLMPDWSGQQRPPQSHADKLAKRNAMRAFWRAQGQTHTTTPKRPARR